VHYSELEARWTESFICSEKPFKPIIDVSLAENSPSNVGQSRGKYPPERSEWVVTFSCAVSVTANKSMTLVCCYTHRHCCAQAHNPSLNGPGNFCLHSATIPLLFSSRIPDVAGDKDLQVMLWKHAWSQ
jgi:hypothetical protein